MFWEHDVLVFGTNDVSGMQRSLSNLGSVGWEVAGISGVDNTVGMNSVLVVVKRRRDTPMPPDDASPGWKPDPWRRFADRWWNGEGWEEHVNQGKGSQPTYDWPLGQPAP